MKAKFVQLIKRNFLIFEFQLKSIQKHVVFHFSLSSNFIRKISHSQSILIIISFYRNKGNGMEKCVLLMHTQHTYISPSIRFLFMWCIFILRKYFIYATPAQPKHSTEAVTLYVHHRHKCTQN